MPDDRLPLRTLRTSAWVAGWFGVVFAVRGQADVSLGLLLGACIGCSSLWTLMWAVPRLMRPDASGSQLLLGVILFLKLPLYAVALNYAMTSRYISAFAVFSGAALIPTVLTLKVLGHQLFGATDAPAGDGECQNTKAGR